MSTKESTAAPTAEAPNAQPPAYSVFTPVEKRIIVALVAYAAWFSTLTGYIYYPAIHQLAETFSVPVEKINLTVTTYMAVATIAPTLVGDTADVLGRRPVYVVLLSLYIGVNIAIVLADSYAGLLGLRVVQALAISGTFSIAYGVITDVASPAERGSYVNMVSFAYRSAACPIELGALPLKSGSSITTAASIGPIFGGTLSYAAGWQWIFWFLSIAAASCLSIMVFFLPETSRSVVGNGSLKPFKYWRLPLPKIMCHWTDSADSATVRWRVPNPLKSLKIIARKDNAVIMLAGGLLYVIPTCIYTALSVLFIDLYKLNQWQAGLTYLPFGLGGVASTLFSGRLIDHAYRNFRLKKGLSTDRIAGDDLDDFPIERARLCVVWAPMLVTACSVMAFGWVLDRRQHIAIPLCLQFITGLCMQIEFSVSLFFAAILQENKHSMVYNTLLVDKNYRNPAAAQASSNIVRCSLAAIAVTFIQDLIDSMGIGWTFTFLGGLCLVAMGLFGVDFFKGTSWRQKHIAS
ncbi:MAG: hypothetical protein Q9211_002468 [Gyalolechia sp. 1 TL-2023]